MVQNENNCTFLLSPWVLWKGWFSNGSGQAIIFWDMESAIQLTDFITTSPSRLLHWRCHAFWFQIYFKLQSLFKYCFVWTTFIYIYPYFPLSTVTCFFLYLHVYILNFSLLTTEINFMLFLLQVCVVRNFLSIFSCFTIHLQIYLKFFSGYRILV